ncbi:MAG: flagellar motor switch protein FliN [Thermoleophilales bacterium]|nr:flagellar motor switch protein FliN [Thermoleophilales bacterium]
MNTENALHELTASTAQAALETLQLFCDGAVEMTGTTVVPRGTNPLGALEFPAVTASIQYLDGVSGGNIFAITAEGARQIAAAMSGGELPDDDSGDEIAELAVSAVGEAANQMLAATAAATAKALGEEVEIDPPKTRIATSAADAMADQPMTQHVTAVSFTVLGQPCRLVQLIPQSFIVKMQFALQDRAGEIDPDDAAVAVAEPRARIRGQGDWLRASKLELAVELGRARMTASKAVALPAGAIVELNRNADEPVDLYVNGAPFARGRLVLVGGTDWAVRIESFENDAAAPAAAGPTAN